MFYSIKLHVWLTLLTKLCFAGDVKQYECGAHGKFEYCIDGIPGCVVGCHCHPGYYFDTDSKICEPNTKLLNIRRHYDGGTYPIHEVHSQLPNLYPTATPPVTNSIDQKVEDIANNADDIGDWLFNQFSKTIESQIINNTNNEKPPTRRSGGNITTKGKKRIRKVPKSQKKKDKHKRKDRGLRRKLLRITEDDSLFESHSGSDESDDISSSSESDSSDTSCDSDERTSRKKHGHRKLLVFNKKGKPPLPSFIFLPSMNTGYYPPIGLPPPPVMPMYPVAPIPPMAPLFPFSVPQSSDKPCVSEIATVMTVEETKPTVKTTLAITPTISTKVSETPKQTETTTQSDTTTPTKTTTQTTTTTKANDSANKNDTKPGGRTRMKKRRGSRPTHPISSPALRTHSSKQRRNKMMQKLRQQVLKNSQSPEDNFQNDNPDIMYDETLMNEPESFSYSQKEAPAVNKIPKMRNVDFTYLSDLIHKANLKNTQPNHANNEDIMKNSNKLSDFSQISRRNLDYNVQPYAELINSFNGPNKIAAVPGSTDYYANLGRQIASMVRGVNLNGEQQINIEVEQMNFEPTINPIMNINRLAPQSYWERSVRSPLYYLKGQKVNDNVSNDKLFSLEKEVENFANTKPPMTLQDLENVLNTINIAQFRLHENVYPGQQSVTNKSFNINLLPETELVDDPNYSKPKYFGNISLRRKVSLPVADTTYMTNMTKNGDINYRNLQNENINGDYNWKPTRKALKLESVPLGMIPKDVEYLNFFKVRPQIKSTTQSPYVNYHSQIMNYPLKLENRFDYESKPSSNQIPLTRKYLEKRPEPSYFHHHFDYFD